MQDVESRAGSPRNRPRDVRLPERYSIVARDKERVLTCIEAPTMAVRVERGLAVGSATARKSPPGTIFLDGAAQDAPFIDAEKQVFNLDHHEGCVRDFTLATCEQAMVIVRKGLDLRGRDWTIFANEPDMDAIFAIWILLNHIRLNDENHPEIRTRVMPLVRLQGTIDAHGLELQDLTGFPPRLHRATFAHLERLRAREVQLKKEGRWQEVDFLDYTLGVLREIDQLFYSTQHFQGVLEVEELARSVISDRWLVIACRAHVGIYEVEQYLRRLHGDRLGIIILQKDPATYTLRRVNHFLPVSLEGVYDQLNRADPAAGSPRSGNRWGGSSDIGGSPRGTGTHLSAQEIVEVCSQAYRRPTGLYRVSKIVQGILASGIVLLAAVTVVFLHGVFRLPFPAIAEVFYSRTNMVAAVFGGLSFVFLMGTAWRGPGYFGIRKPSGADWLYLLPLALVASLAGGAWFPGALAPGRALSIDHSWDHVVVALSLALSAELLFRGLVQTIPTQAFQTQKSGGRWFVSIPVIVSSLTYVAWALAPFDSFSFPSGAFIAAGTLALGFACGLARERSESLVPPILIHWACLLVPVLVVS